jgi:hypothetical protein
MVEELPVGLKLDQLVEVWGCILILLDFVIQNKNIIVPASVQIVSWITKC